MNSDEEESACGLLFICIMSGHRFPHNYIPSKLGQVSLLTRDDFSLEFHHDNTVSRGLAGRSDPDRFHLRRMGFSSKMIEDLTVAPELRRTESDSAYDAEGSCRVRRKPNHARAASEEAVLSPSFAMSIQETQSQPHLSGPFGGNLQSDNLKFICSFGGKILPRPSDGKLRYVGGETRIISVGRNLSWEELMQKTRRICNYCFTIKYPLPGEDLDSLVSVSTDEDLQNMVEEYRGLNSYGSNRVRIFLIALDERESSSYDMRSPVNCSEDLYVAAVNGVSPGRSSSGESLNQLEHDDAPLVSFHDPVGSFLTSNIIDEGKTLSPGGFQLNRSSQTVNPTFPSSVAPSLVLHKDLKVPVKKLTEEKFLSDRWAEDPHFPHGYSKNIPRVHENIEVSKQESKHQILSFHTEKFPEERNECQRTMSGPNEIAASNFEFPHVFSDPVLFQHADTSFLSLEGETVSSVSFTNPQFPQIPLKENQKTSLVPAVKQELSDSLRLLGTTYFNAPQVLKDDFSRSIEERETLQQVLKGDFSMNIEETEAEITQEYPACKIEVTGLRGAHLSSQELDALERSVPASFFLSSRLSLSVEEQSRSKPHSSCFSMKLDANSESRAGNSTEKARIFNPEQTGDGHAGTFSGEVSLIDQDPLNEYREMNIELDKTSPIKGLVMVEDVTAGVPLDIPISPTIVPHVTHQGTFDIESYMTSSFTLGYEGDVSEIQHHVVYFIYSLSL